MGNKENGKGFLLYLIIGLIYAVALGIMFTIFNLFSDDPTPTSSIIVQSILFGIFMSLFEMWIQNRRNKK